MDSIKNKTLYFGDNLDILRDKFPNTQGGYFDLVYLDPPFNSNRNYNQIFEKHKNVNCVAQTHAFEDSWTWGDDADKTYKYLTSDKKIDSSIHALMNGLMQILGNNDMMAYLVMMTVRLIELHRVLKDTGSIYLHCDPHASHYLKIVMDNVFGVSNFQNEIIWRYRSGGASKTRFGRKHDVIFFYSKTNKYKFNQLRGELYHTDGLSYEKDGTPYKMKSGEKLYFNKEGGVMADVWEGEADVWDIPFLSTVSKERLGYPTQKPEALLERIIKASSNDGDWILDPFVGCGTCVSVAEKLKRNWVGIDITPLAIDVIKRRLNKQYPNIKIEMDGLPKDMLSAITLAEKCGRNGRFDFQYWILGLLDAMPTKGKSKNNKKGSDEGIDGVIIFEDLNKKIEKLIVSVKSGKNTSVIEIRDLKGVIEREKAIGGLFVTLYPPTEPMVKEAVIAGTYKYFNKDIRKIQIIMVEDILNGKKPDIPITQQSPHKDAIKVKMPEQTTLSEPIKNTSPL